MRVRSVSVLVAVLVLVGSADADIVNPSFEGDGQYVSGPPVGWTRDYSPVFGCAVTDDVYTYDWHTDGDCAFRIWSCIGNTFSAGSYESIYQVVDLTGVSGVLFDAKLSGNCYGYAPFDHFAAAFLVDGASSWTQTSGGTYLDQLVDTSALSGFHTIELRNYCLDSGTHDASYWTEWDNLRAIPEPASLALLAFGGVSMLVRRKGLGRFLLS